MQPTEVAKLGSEIITLERQVASSLPKFNGGKEERESWFSGHRAQHDAFRCRLTLCVRHDL